MQASGEYNNHHGLQQQQHHSPVRIAASDRRVDVDPDHEGDDDNEFDDASSSSLRSAVSEAAAVTGLAAALTSMSNGSSWNDDLDDLSWIEDIDDDDDNNNNKNNNEDEDDHHIIYSDIEQDKQQRLGRILHPDHHHSEPRRRRAQTYPARNVSSTSSKHRYSQRSVFWNSTNIKASRHQSQYHPGYSTKSLYTSNKYKTKRGSHYVVDRRSSRKLKSIWRQWWVWCRRQRQYAMTSTNRDRAASHSSLQQKLWAVEQGELSSFCLEIDYEDDNDDDKDPIHANSTPRRRHGEQQKRRHDRLEQLRRLWQWLLCCIRQTPEDEDNQEELNHAHGDGGAPSPSPPLLPQQPQQQKQEAALPTTLRRYAE